MNFLSSPCSQLATFAKVVSALSASHASAIYERRFDSSSSSHVFLSSPPPYPVRDPLAPITR